MSTVMGPAAGLSQTRTGDLLLIAPQSAAAQLFEKCARAVRGQGRAISRAAGRARQNSVRAGPENDFHHFDFQ
jgi:hypothetical protein